MDAPGPQDDPLSPGGSEADILGEARSPALAPSPSILSLLIRPPMSERTCRLVTLGCKVNQYETQLVKEALEQNGFREAIEDEPADLCVVNSCTVTAESDAKSRKAIRQLARQNPGARTIVMGCYATRDPDAMAELPGVFEVVADKQELPDVLKRQGVVDIPEGVSYFQARKRAYVKVQDGCLLRCTYCIIPQVRPVLRSRPPGDVETEVRRLIDNGYREIVVSGIHVGHFGVETTRRKSGRAPFRLWHLLRRLDRIPGQWRMRLSSIEANEVGEDFIQAAADCEHLCPQFHPALQSGSDAVLGRMRRRYRVARFLDKLERIRDAIPSAAFTTDVMVGFPGETEEEFEETLAAVRQARFMKIHIFPFSARKGTPAATAVGQVSPEVRKSRCRRLAAVERELARLYYESLIGRDVEVLVERECPDWPGCVSGTDRHYVPVVLPGGRKDLGELVSARGVSCSSKSLRAMR